VSDRVTYHEGHVLAIVVLLGSLLISTMGIGFVVPFLPVIATDLGATGFAVGVMMAVFSLSMGVSQPFVGSISDRYGRKPFLVVGLVIYSACGFAYILASSLFEITAVRFIQGFGGGLVFSVSMAYMGDLAPKEYEGRYMGIYNVALFAGFGLGPLFGGVLKDLFGMAAAFYGMGMSSAAASVICLLFLPSRSPQVTKEEHQGVRAVFQAILSERRMRGVLLARLAVMLSMVPSFIFLPIIMTQVMAASGTQIGVVITSRTLVSAILQYPFGLVADKYNRGTLTLVALLGMAGLVCMIGFSTEFWQLLILFGCLGISEAIFMPANSAMTLEGGRAFGMGSTMGVINTAMSVGMLIGSMAAGLLVDAVGMTIAFAIVGLVVVLCAAISWPMIRAPLSGHSFEDTPALAMVKEVTVSKST
jgi:DHA1 family multidrug resistance protein-like MFS transporter